MLPANVAASIGHPWHVSQEKPFVAQPLTIWKSRELTLALTRSSATATRASVKLSNNLTETQIGCSATVRLGDVNQLVAVMVHLHPTAWANHLVSVGHNSSPLFSGSVERDVLAAVTQCLGHPDEFLQKFVDASNVGWFE
jgi:hypothetical protein